jgi:acyl dehydratase
VRYFEDFEPGDAIECGARALSREEILAFAVEYDPQPFHLDDAAAGASIYGGIIASGWQTASVTHGLFVRSVAVGMASMGSPGVDELRWLKPVRPGDTLAVRAVVLDKAPSASRPDRGRVRMRFETRNQDGELVMTMVATGIIGRRPAP